LTVNVIHQLASLYHARQKLYQYTFRQVHLLPPLEGMAELLSVLVRVDSIIAHNPNIEEAWSKYKAMMQYVRAEPDRYNANPQMLRQF
jgi:WASH complex subunit 7